MRETNEIREIEIVARERWTSAKEGVKGQREREKKGREWHNGF